MEISYNKLWKLLIENKMKKKDLQERTGISEYTIKKLKCDFLFDGCIISKEKISKIKLGLVRSQSEIYA